MALPIGPLKTKTREREREREDINASLTN